MLYFKNLEYDNARSIVYYRIFGTLDYLSFNVNRKIIDDKRLIQCMTPSINQILWRISNTCVICQIRAIPSHTRNSKGFISNSRNKMRGSCCHR